jgi:hypothetical protein
VQGQQLCYAFGTADAEKPFQPKSSWEPRGAGIISVPEPVGQRYVIENLKV